MRKKKKRGKDGTFSYTYTALIFLSHNLPVTILMQHKLILRHLRGLCLIITPFPQSNLLQALNDTSLLNMYDKKTPHDLSHKESPPIY